MKPKIKEIQKGSAMSKKFIWILRINEAAVALENLKQVQAFLKAIGTEVYCFRCDRFEKIKEVFEVVQKPFESFIKVKVRLDCGHLDSSAYLEKVEMYFAKLGKKRKEND